MTKTILTLIALVFSIINLFYGQTGEGINSNPYFEIVNMDNSGKVTPAQLLVNKKVNHDSRYETLFTYDFDKNGKLDKIFYSFGSQGVARFLMTPEGNMETTSLFSDPFDIPEENEGFWFYISDIFENQTPEILIFSKIGARCFLKIINYSTNKKSFVEHTYILNDVALSKQLLIKNQKKIFIPIGSQGLFDEIPLIVE